MVILIAFVFHHLLCLSHELWFAFLVTRPRRERSLVCIFGRFFVNSFRVARARWMRWVTAIMFKRAARTITIIVVAFVFGWIGSFDATTASWSWCWWVCFLAMLCYVIGHITWLSVPSWTLQYSTRVSLETTLRKRTVQAARAHSCLCRFHWLCITGHDVSYVFHVAEFLVDQHHCRVCFILGLLSGIHATRLGIIVSDLLTKLLLKPIHFGNKPLLVLIAGQRRS